MTEPRLEPAEALTARHEPETLAVRNRESNSASESKQEELT